jgi:rRNA processing protein Krr1/Pno1
MSHNEITPELKKIIERYLGKHLPEGIIGFLRDTGYSYRLDFRINMSDLLENRLNLVNSRDKMDGFVEQLTRIVNSLFQVNIMYYGYIISIIGEKEWVNNVFSKKIKQSLKNTEGSECIASIKIIRDVGKLQYDIVFGIKKNCQPNMCYWTECEERRKALTKLGGNLRETLNTFNLSEDLFTIKLGGRDVRSEYIF